MKLILVNSLVLVMFCRVFVHQQGRKFFWGDEIEKSLECNCSYPNEELELNFINVNVAIRTFPLDFALVSKYSEEYTCIEMIKALFLLYSY